jgi:hypothetical protein
MRLLYGPYPHNLNECGIAFSKQPEFSPSGIEIGVRHTWDITGQLILPENAESIVPFAQALENAYTYHGQDAYLLDDNDGIVRSLRSADAIGGVRIVRKPSFPEFNGGQWANCLSYGITLEAVFPSSDLGAGLLDFQETVSIQGNGQGRWIYLEVLNGPPVRQQITQATTVKVTQSGSAVGYLGAPFEPAPLFPQAVHWEQSSVQRGSPKRTGSGSNAWDTGFTVSWNYVMEITYDPSPVFPTLRPA